MYRPNKVCIISVASGKTDVYGQPLPARKVREQCAVVKLDMKSAKSPIRADSSASRGNAREVHTDAVILLGPNTVANIDDVVDLGYTTVRIIEKHPRFNMAGTLDHFEMHATTWSV